MQIINSPQYSEGIYLVNRKGSLSSGYYHYGFAVSGKFLNYFNLPKGVAKVIHKDNKKVVADDYDALSWQVIHKMPENEIPLAIIRTKQTLNESYNLLSNNCEHFARYVTTGKKESSQIQVLGVLAVSAALIWLGSND